MNIIDHLHNNSTLSIDVYDLNTNDIENEFITGDTKFDYELTINFADGKSITYKDKGDWVCDIAEKYAGEHFESNEEDLRGELKFALIRKALEDSL